MLLLIFHCTNHKRINELRFNDQGSFTPSSKPESTRKFSELVRLLVGLGIEHRVLGILGKHSNFQATLLVPLRFLDEGGLDKKAGL